VGRRYGGQGVVSALAYVLWRENIDLNAVTHKRVSRSERRRIVEMEAGGDEDLCQAADRTGTLASVCERIGIDRHSAHHVAAFRCVKLDHTGTDECPVALPAREVDQDAPHG
jgi:hypothetical protein